MTIWDHTVTPPQPYQADSGGCVAIRGMSVPVDNPPAALGIYPEGDDDACPAGHRIVSSSRVIRDGKS